MATENFWTKTTGPAASVNCSVTGAANVGDACTITGGRSGPVVHSDGSYLSVLTGNAYSTWISQTGIIFDWPATYTMDSITTLNINMRQWRDKGSGTGPSVLWALALASGEIDFTSGALDQWVDLAAAPGRTGGGAWQVADLTDSNHLYIRCFSAFPNGDFVRYASVYGSIVYVPRYGGFFAILGFAAMAVLPFQSDFNRLLDYKQLHEARRPTLTEPEREQAWREYRAFTNPKHFVLGKEA